MSISSCFWVLRQMMSMVRMEKIRKFRMLQIKYVLIAMYFQFFKSKG